MCRSPEDAALEAIEQPGGMGLIEAFGAIGMPLAGDGLEGVRDNDDWCRRIGLARRPRILAGGEQRLGRPRMARALAIDTSGYFPKLSSFSLPPKRYIIRH